MAEPSDIPRSPEEWGAWAAGAMALALGLKKGLQKVGIIGAPPDFDAMAEAFFAKKREDDREHRDAIVTALHEVANTVRDVNAATTANIRTVLELYGKDVSEIRDAQERADRQLSDITKALADLRVEVAKR